MLQLSLVSPTVGNVGSLALNQLKGTAEVKYIPYGYDDREGNELLAAPFAFFVKEEKANYLQLSTMKT